MSEDHEADRAAEDESTQIPEEERVPLSSLRERLEARTAGGEGEDEIDTDAPLSELAEEATASSEAERSELFEEVDVADVDAEAIWDAVVEEGDPPEELFAEPEEPSPPEPTSQPDEHVIDKREYCQRCEFFTEPPGVSCSNDGTEIVELVDNDSFRVHNCPKVGADDEALRSMIGDEQS
jgi:hypothetical protein